MPSTEKLTRIIRMWAACILCILLLGILVPTSDAISAVIAPPNELYVLKGDNITITCTLLDLNLSSFTAEDILWTKDSVSLSSHLSHALSLNTSRLTIVNSTFLDEGNYGCKLPGDRYNDVELLAVSVAVPPGPAKNLACITHDTKNVVCSWEEGTVETNTRNRHIAKFKYYRQDNFLPTTKDGEYSCNFTVEGHLEVTVLVNSTNKVGFATAEVKFHPQKQATPNKPENVAAAPHSENGNRTLFVTWDCPLDWSGSLDYRVHYRRKGSNETKEKKVTGGFTRALLKDLEPFNTYQIEVFAKSVVSNASYWSEPGTAEATTLGGPPSASASVSDLMLVSDTDSIQTGFRHVNLRWQPPPVHQMGSESMSYLIKLVPEDDSPGHSQTMHRVTVSSQSVLIYNVSKYQTYSVNITSRNEYGDGPETMFKNKILDRTDAPGKPEALQVNDLMDNKIFQIKWRPPVNPNGLIYDYEVVVEGEPLLSSNESHSMAGNNTLVISTKSQVIHVNASCKELTETGHPLHVRVAAKTKNYTGYTFKGEYARFIQDGVCKEKAEPKWIFIGIFIPCITIVICIVFLLLWNYLKDKCTEPPEPYIPSIINKNGHIGIGVVYNKVKPERERFDDLNPRREIIDLIGGQQTLPNLYQNPLYQSENTFERINSHDSGVPESPESHCVHGMEFYNRDVAGESINGHHGPLPTISNDDFADTPYGVSSLSRQSSIPNGSVDGCTEVSLKEDNIPVGIAPRLTSSSTAKLPSPDPYFKQSFLSRSSQKSDSSSLYIETPAGQDGRIQGNNEGNDNADELENDCPFEDGESSLAYPQQYQMSPTADVPPYMKMTPTSPPSASKSVPNGYVSQDSLSCPPYGITGSLDAVQEEIEEYSIMVDFREGSECYLQHDAALESKQIPETPAAYIKHTSLLSNDVNYQDNYQDNYPDFGVSPGSIRVPILGTRQESGVYIKHEDISK